MADSDENSAEQVKRAKKALEVLSKETSAKKAQPKPGIDYTPSAPVQAAERYADWVARKQTELAPETDKGMALRAARQRYIDPATRPAERVVLPAAMAAQKYLQSRLRKPEEERYIELGPDEGVDAEASAQETRERNDETIKQLKDRRDSVRRAKKALEDPATKGWSREQWEKWTAEQKD